MNLTRQYLVALATVHLFSVLAASVLTSGNEPAKLGTTNRNSWRRFPRRPSRGKMYYVKYFLELFSECNAPEVLRELTNDYEYFAAQGNLVRKPAQTRSITAFCRAPGDGGFKGSTFKLLEAREFGQNVLYVRIRLTSSRFKAPGYIDYSVSYMLRKVRYGRCHRRPCFKIRGEVQSMSNPRLASMFK